MRTRYGVKIPTKDGYAVLYYGDRSTANRVRRVLGLLNLAGRPPVRTQNGARRLRRLADYASTRPHLPAVAIVEEFVALEDQENSSKKFELGG